MDIEPVISDALEHQLRIRKLLFKYDSLTSGEIGEYTGLTHTQVKEALFVLCDADNAIPAKKNGKTYYSLNPFIAEIYMKK